MSSIDELLLTRTALGPDEIGKLHRVLGSWQLIADLAFADLLLWCPLGARQGFICAGQMRPHTAQTLYPEDRFGDVIRPEELAVVDRAFSEGKLWRRDYPLLIDGVAVRTEAIPVPYGGEIVGVITKEGAPLVHRRPGRLEEVYLECADSLASMVEQGVFPFDSNLFDSDLAPTVGDGLMRVDGDGKILYASPNATSAYRRMGMTSAIEGKSISELPIDLRPVENALLTVQPTRAEVVSGGRGVDHYCIPLVGSASVKGLIVLLRDMTDLRYRDQMLRRKEVHIKEIHHRVKNNLQTIASLLRIQSRRLTAADAKKELEQAVRRISSIALVHETLTRESVESVELRSVIHEIASLVSKALGETGPQVPIVVGGDAGSLPSDLATAVALAVVELLQNAIEHAGGSEIKVDMSRMDDWIQLQVTDRGPGLPVKFGERDFGLGLEIVSAIVKEQLGGQLRIESDGGARLTLSFSAIPSGEGELTAFA